MSNILLACKEITTFNTVPTHAFNMLKYLWKAMNAISRLPFPSCPKYITILLAKCFLSYFHLWERSKSQGHMPGEYGGDPTVSQCNCNKRSLTLATTWVCALLCNMIGGCMQKYSCWMQIMHHIMTLLYVSLVMYICMSECNMPQSA